MDQEDLKTGTENPPEVSPNPPSPGKDDSKKDTDQEDLKTGTENPSEVSPNPLSPGKDDSKKDTDQEDLKTGTENPPEVSPNPPSPGKDDSKKDTDQEDLKTGTENPPEVSPNPPSPGKDDSKKDTDQEDLKTGTENPPEVSPNPPSPGKDDSKKDTDLPEESDKQVSDKSTPRTMKAKLKIVKKSLAAKLKAKKNNGLQQIRQKKMNKKNQKAVDNTESSHDADKKHIPVNNSQQSGINDELPKEKNQEAEKIEVTESQNRVTSDKSPVEKRHQAQKDKQQIEPSEKAEQTPKNKRKRRESNKGSRIRKNKDKQTGPVKSESKDKKSESSDKKSERLGGLIFMCNAKTKPDCFRYRVMGVSAGKKDAVLGVKPGLKLFLYDFDLKLLYGIYKASSSGGMKLEPRAFHGKFPAQVRFSIASDCYPLPESVFQKAIKENYYEKNKFKTELTLSQVRKLTRLFRPVGAHSAAQTTHSPRKTIIREREAPDGARGSWSCSHRERAVGHQLEQREEINRDLYRAENYRAYGLQGDRRNVAPTSHVNPILEPYGGDYGHHTQDPIYRSNVLAHVPAHVESRHMDSHENYYRGAVSDHVRDPHYEYRYGASPRDVYVSREDITSSSYLVGRRPVVGTDNLQRREIVPDRLYSAYSAADALPDYHRMQPYHGDRLEGSPARVSARYSFAGPSYYRR